MIRSDIKELYYITPIKNVPSIMELGILSNKQALNIPHGSVASLGVQKRRDRKRVTRERWLHEYANLYIDARNVMLYLVVKVWKIAEVCVLRVSSTVLDLGDVVISDTNAARDLVRFEPAPSGLRMLDKNLVFAQSWNDPDPNEKYRKSGIKCAEVLVPNKIPPGYITGAYAVCEEDKKALVHLTGVRFSVSIDKHMFFQKE